MDGYENMLMTTLYQMVIELDRINDARREEQCLQKVYDWYNQKILSTYINKITRSREHSPLHTQQAHTAPHEHTADEQ